MKHFLLLAVITMTACGRGAAPVGQTEGPVSATGGQRPEVVQAEHGMIASDNALATEVGVSVLQNGGNAVDAAIATAFALAVAYPEAGNLGGGGFLLARLADGRSFALDFREKAPLRATHDMYLDSAGNVTSKSLIGHLASGVPGSVAGLWAAHERLGSRPWAELVAPAIQLAETGFTVDQHFAAVVADHEERLQQFAASAAHFLPDGKPLQTGSRWRNPELAAVLRRIANQGATGFYEGETANLIVAEMQRGGGLISLEDLKRYQPKWREPVEFTYRGHRIISMPPASSGGLTLALLANIAEGYDLRALGRHSPEALHVVAEAARRAFADRNYFLGDADFVKVPSARFLSEEYAQRQRATISLRHATPSSQVRPGLDAAVEGSHTTHFSVVDAQGNAVALTTTLNELFGSAVTVTGAGFLLNDEMDDFSAKPGSPNLFGLVQGEPNAIAPEKRMLSAMTPTIVLDERGQLLLITGARGGPRIISAVFQIVSNVIDYDLPLADALGGPRIHHQHLPDILYYEQGFPSQAAHALQALGHTVQERSGYIGSAPTILRVGNHWEGAPDPRSGGLAKGY
ncbi:MAG TPA: gamma-glutamyltransferase [Longimicrobiales bacterium]|nr:gamma-glutamyltransferase [Longimicrobiales bacterium]